MSATSASAGAPAPAPSGGSDSDSLLAVAVVALAGLVGWSMMQGGAAGGNAPNTSTKGDVPGKDKGEVLMEF